MSLRHAMLAGTVSALALTAGAAAAQDTGQATTVDEIIVTGIRASIEESIDTKRNADAVVEVITAEDVGKFPDKNVAEALQRVPGIVINREFGEGERVSLRGTSPNLTRTLIDGHGLATADWFILEQLSATRSFNFLMLPSEIIGQTLVYKSPMADIEEGGIGGTIDTRTRRPLDLQPFEAFGSIQGSYNENAGDIDPNASALISWHNEDETFGVLVAGIYQKRNIRRDAVEVLGYFDNDPGAGELLVPSLIGSALFVQERVREGANFAVQWRPNDQLDLSLTGLYSRFGADNFNQNFLAWGSNALGGGGTLTNTTIVNGTAVAGTIASTPGGRGAVYDAIDREASATTSNIAFDARFTPDDRLTLDLKVGYTEASGDTENQPFVEFGAPATFTYDLRGETPQVRFTNLDPTDPTDMVFDFGSLHEVTNDDSEFYAYFDGEYALDMGPLTAVKAGVKYTDHDRETDFQATTYGGFFLPLLASGCGGPCDPIDFAAGPTPSDFLEDIAAPGTLARYWQVDRGRVQDIFYGLPAAVRARIPNFPEIFSVNEQVTGAYLMAKLGGDDWRGNIGVRVVDTEQTSTGNVQQAVAGPGTVSNAFGTFLPVTASRSYTDVLPSANFAFDLTPDLVMRFAAARTMARPDFTDVAPRVSLNPGSLTGVGGNPFIDPYRANQFDLSMEYYPERGTLFSAAVYYKDIESFITDAPSLETFAIETSTPNLSLCASAGVVTNPVLFNCRFTINRRANGGGARLQGIELAVQKAIWGGFGVQANYSYSDVETDSGDPLPGNSEHSYNVSAYYEDDNISARLAYNYRSEFFVTFDRSTQLNQDEIGSLDGSFAWNVTRQIALTLEGQNLLDEEITQFAGDPIRPRAVYDNGRSIYAGVRFRY